MIERSLAIVSNKTRRGSLALRNDLRNSFRVERVLERNSLKLKSKLVEERDRTLKALALRSTQKEKDKKGGVGGALSLLGGGALGRRFFGRPRGGGGLRIPKVPKVPTRGGAFLSRVGKVGRLGKIGPLAVIGTGIDFAGRKAEGQTNLQAGLGAGGGLAGALAGAKYGAILGTAIGGPIGTVVGGIGGSIIGGLAGGKLADMFSGADRRRKFEEQRVIISTQKTLFSSALDDLDRVLDRLEKTPLILKKDDDDGIPRRDSPFAFFGLIRRPKPPKMKFIDRPIVKDIGYTAAFTGLLFLSVLAIGSSPGTPEDAGLILLLRQTVQKSPFLMKIAKNIIKFPKPTPKPEFLKPGVDIPGISAKGIRIRAEALLKKINPNIKFDNVPKKQPSLKELLKKERILQDKLYEIIKNAPPEKFREIMEKFIKKGKVPSNKTIENFSGKAQSGGKSKTFTNRTPDNPSGGINFDKTNPGGGAFSGNNLSFDSDGNTGSDNIALAPINNIFLMNQENSNSSTPQTQGGTTILIGGGTMDSFDAEINIRQMEILQTA